jgi:FAD:protein FMN transferase
VSSAPVAASFPALGSTAVVAVTKSEVLAHARAMLAEDLTTLDLACSRFRPDSELVRVNAHAGESIHVSALLAAALRVALDAAEMSDGLVDPTLGVQLRAAGYDRTFSLVRERGTWRIAPASPRTVSWQDIELNDADGRLRVPQGLELDLGATAKAWAADQAVQRIAADLGSGALVSLGGDIAVAGVAPPEGWAVQLAEDHEAPLSGQGPVVAISTGGLATSSTGVRRWHTDHGDAHHILDPRSGRSAVTPWRYVSVAAATCVDANVASTAAIVLGEEALDWLAVRGLPARAVRRDGSVAMVGAWPADEVRAA